MARVMASGVFRQGDVVSRPASEVHFAAEALVSRRIVLAKVTPDGRVDSPDWPIRATVMYEGGED